jgi:hypothetical protein
LVTFVRSLTVAKVDSQVGRAQVHPVLGRAIIERQQLVLILGDLGGGLRELRPVSGGERLHRSPGVILVLGIPDLRQRLLRARVRGPRQRAENVSDGLAGTAYAHASWKISHS